MRTHQAVVEVRTAGRGFSNVTEQISAVVRESAIKTGICTVFLQHTSASLLIQENADPAVLGDLGRFLGDLAPESRDWEHDDEGPDDMPAHAKAALMRTSETIPISRGALALGTWQGLYVVEHRARPHGRRLVVTVMGD
jgi:secondary thiamine-phosphate synthase enzyme